MVAGRRRAGPLEPIAVTVREDQSLWPSRVFLQMFPLEPKIHRIIHGTRRRDVRDASGNTMSSKECILRERRCRGQMGQGTVLVGRFHKRGGGGR